MSETLDFLDLLLELFWSSMSMLDELRLRLLDGVEGPGALDEAEALDGAEAGLESCEGRPAVLMIL